MLPLYPRYVSNSASVSEIRASTSWTPHNSTGRFTHRMASQLMIGRSWNSSSVSEADWKNSVLFPTVHPKLCARCVAEFLQTMLVQY